MIKGKKLLAVIPARGGSKRLPRKNILDLAGKPLIAWTIETALESTYIDKLIVSTDDKSILNIAKKYDACIPYLRPYELATDESLTVDVVIHLLNELEKNGERYDYIILLQPTSPLRRVDDIDKSIELLQNSSSDAVVSVCEAEHSPLWCNTLPDDLSMDNFIDESVKSKRSQDLPGYYRINGAIYIISTERLKEEKSFFLKDNVFAYKMGRENSIDVDEEIDFRMAEVFLKGLKEP